MPFCWLLLLTAHFHNSEESPLDDTEGRTKRQESDSSVSPCQGGDRCPVTLANVTLKLYSCCFHPLPAWVHFKNGFCCTAFQGKGKNTLLKKTADNIQRCVSSFQTGKGQIIQVLPYNCSFHNGNSLQQSVLFVPVFVWIDRSPGLIQFLWRLIFI